MAKSSDRNSPSFPDSTLKKVWNGFKAYLTDWRNLLGHALLGVFFVVVAVWAPINIWLKLAIIACLITLNILRMRLKSKKLNEQKESAAE